METYVSEKERDLVAENYYRYYRAFSLSGIVKLHEGPVEWIIPKEGENGPSLAFHLRLDEDTYEEQLQSLIEGIKENKVPSRWIITPDAMPQNAVALLESKGFRNLSSGASEPEPGMILHKNDFTPYFSEEESMVYRRVETKEDFRAWIDVVNTALHGWEMIDAQHYYTWVETENIRLYLCVIDGVPVSTAATIQTGDVASLEFVSTLSQHRRRKAAITLNSYALTQLFGNGVRAVTLSGSSEAVALYEKLGFHGCFENIIMQYEM